MTPTSQEIAEKIMEEWRAIPGHPKNRRLSDLESRYAAALEQFRRDAFEEAAKAAENYDPTKETRSGLWAAGQIRALAGKGDRHE